MNMKHFVITGGAGFIGSNLVRALLNNQPDATITCIDNFDPFYASAIKELNIRDFAGNSRFRLLKNDLAHTSGKELSQIITEPVDAILHLAAKAGVRPSIENPEAYQQVNVMGLQHMLDFAKEKNIRQFIFASSSSVYGVNDHFPWKEEEKLMPISPYASTKLSGEMMGHVYHKLFGIRFLALRFFTVYGPGQRPDLAIHKFTKAILQGKPVMTFGDGSTSRDYTYVDDTVKGVLGALAYDKTGFEIINLGNNYTVSLKEMVAAIEEVIGKKAIIQHYPEQPGDVPKTFADINRAKQLFNYDPQTKFRDGLVRFYEWFVANKEILL
jgi:UDP-glucuronate 4-epimerase